MKLFTVLRGWLVLAVGLLASGAFAQYTVDFSNSRGTGTGQGTVLIENIHVFVPVENPFQPGTFTAQEVDFNANFYFDPGTLHLVPESITQFGGALSCSTASVQVRSAVTGLPISGATVIAGTTSVLTNSDGIATFSNLAQGYVSFSVVASGYVTVGRAQALACNVVTPVSLALSPVGGNTGGLAAGQFRIILTWGANPSDLDSHLTGPDGAGGRWHVYYSNHTGGGICGLDVDDTSSYGPETITCPATGTSTSLQPGVYRYSVHHYSGSGTIASSGASVRLEFGNGATYTYTAPAGGFSGTKDVWTVFELTVFNNGTIGIAPVGTIYNQTSAGSILMMPRSTGVHFGRPEDPAMFDGINKK